jgi:hypothetical protein
MSKVYYLLIAQLQLKDCTSTPVLIVFPLHNQIAHRRVMVRRAATPFESIECTSSMAYTCDLTFSNMILPTAERSCICWIVVDCFSTFTSVQRGDMNEIHRGLTWTAGYPRLKLARLPSLPKWETISHGLRMKARMKSGISHWIYRFWARSTRSTEILSSGCSSNRKRSHSDENLICSGRIL